MRIERVAAPCVAPCALMSDVDLLNLPESRAGPFWLVDVVSKKPSRTPVNMLVPHRGCGIWSDKRVGIDWVLICVLLAVLQGHSHLVPPAVPRGKDFSAVVVM